MKIQIASRACLALLFITGVSLANAQSSLPLQDITGGGQYLADSDGTAPTAGSQTIPYWTGQFTDPTVGVSYSYKMVGQGDPRQFNGTTAIQVDLIPINLLFAGSGGYALSGSDEVASVLASP